MYIDPIADMLTRIRNANTNKHESVLVPQSKTKLAIAEILKVEGYIVDYKATVVDNVKMIQGLRVPIIRTPTITTARLFIKLVPECIIPSTPSLFPPAAFCAF